VCASTSRERLPVKVYDEGHDTPDQAPSWHAGWTDGDKAVLLYDQHDIWEIRPDGTNARNITGGEAANSTSYYIRWRPEREADPGDEAVDACHDQ
jgi:hypothetical protein